MMMKKTLIATATAGLIAAGAMVGTTSTASAAPGFYFGGPGWSFGFGNGHRWDHRQVRRECRPVFRTMHWRDYWGRMHYKRVIVGRDCHRTNGRRFGRDRGPNPGWGRDWGHRWH